MKCGMNIADAGENGTNSFLACRDATHLQFLKAGLKRWCSG